MFIGLALIAIGLIFLLERLGVIEGGLGQYWPVLLIAIGVAIVIEQFRKKRG